MAGFARLRAPAGVTESDAASIGPGALATIPGGFAGLRALVQARNMAQAEHVARQNALMEMLLARFRSAMGAVSQPAGTQLTRPWPGIYKAAESAGRTVPKSYGNPRTYTLEP